MNKLKEILSRSIKRNGLRLYDHSAALELLQFAEENHIDILGIDAFIVKEDSIQPVSEHSIDFTSSNKHSKLFRRLPHNSKSAKDFLMSKKGMGFMFEIVTDNQELDP